MIIASATATAQEPLPAPSGRPFEIDFATDPVLRLRLQQADQEAFRALVASAVEQHPGTAEAAAGEDEALAGLSEARSAVLPTLDATVTSYRVLSREFSDDPTNIIESSRPEQRTDAILTAQQTLFDFGATSRRISAAGARLRAAGSDLEATADQIAMNAIGAWYDVFGYRALVALTEAFADSQRELREAVEMRIREGASAEGDLPRVDSYIAQAETRLARFRRQLAGAEARFTELAGMPPPAELQRAPAMGVPVQSRDEAALAAMESPAVRSAQAQADASRQEARAARADRLPQFSAGIDAGRYGVFETDRDYDIRGRLAMRWRLLGNADARADQADARARAADARAMRITEEAERDAAIAWSDVRALEQQLRSLEQAYIASRQSRDVIAERFRSARGTLFDVVDAEDAYFESATSYIQALTELDAARYVLLSRTGRLLEALRIDADRLRGEGER
ncbi:TolC family protein [Sphingosinicella sp. CPCC 101087]|uniref:TolC family protein n=1 Tax=Sphingosinicella sp. CPCC 101087 TaxID=2497754 RepID=UPI00101D5B6C|nr:TolC family protein [Sphingosinicella sp. CPCC 101087]